MNDNDYDVEYEKRERQVQNAEDTVYWAVVAVLAVLLAVGLYRFFAGWF